MPLKSGSESWQHPRLSRRIAVRAGALGLFGLNQLALESARGDSRTTLPAKAKSCIYIFLSGGLAQHESFDLKPEAPTDIRGEFQPIASSIPGIDICEHLPRLATRAQDWALLRSLTHPTNDHTLGHYLMLTGRSIASPGFSGDRKTSSSDWPSIASIVGDALPSRCDTLPRSIVLPERLVHWSGGVIPGAYGGLMGRRRDPFFIEASPYGNPFWRGAYPEYTFPNESKKPPANPDARVYQAPEISLAPGLTSGRFVDRMALLKEVDRQRNELERSASQSQYDLQRQSVVSLLSDSSVRNAFDVTHANEKTQERYGRNSFGWSLLMAYRLVSAGVNMVQVNLGSNETWDTHGDAFPRLKDKLLPPTDRALSALLDDLTSSGLFDSTLIVMAGEFGRTPKISTLPESYFSAGRDHWGAVQSVFFAGGGIRGGTVVGASDKIGGYPARDAQRPENMAATIYHALGIAPDAAWLDDLGRPSHLYHGEPIHELFA